MNRFEYTRRAAFALVVFAMATIALGPAMAGGGDADGPPVKEIKMTVENWKWTPAMIRVPVGTKVRLEITSYDATHRFDLKALKIKANLPEDETTIVEFVASKVGEFKWKCGRPCGNGCPKMIGKLIVTEAGEEDDGGR
jgi:heme/copper-type cytochrome/quinol oxidase subunit 2